MEVKFAEGLSRKVTNVNLPANGTGNANFGTLRFDGLTQNGGALPNLAYTLQAVSLTDPISPQPADPNYPGDSYVYREDLPGYYTAITYDAARDVVW